MEARTAKADFVLLGVGVVTAGVGVGVADETLSFSSTGLIWVVSPATISREISYVSKPDFSNLKT